MNDRCVTPEEMVSNALIERKLRPIREWMQLHEQAIETVKHDLRYWREREERDKRERIARRGRILTNAAWIATGALIGAWLAWVTA